MFSSNPHPWFRPLHRRIITLAVCVGWLVIELIGQQMMWVVIAGALSVYAVWEFFLGPNYRRTSEPAPADSDSDSDSDP